jgi:hypothetical protein
MEPARPEVGTGSKGGDPIARGDFLAYVNQSIISVMNWHPASFDFDQIMLIENI